MAAMFNKASACAPEAAPRPALGKSHWTVVSLAKRRARPSSAVSGAKPASSSSSAAPSGVANGKSGSAKPKTTGPKGYVHFILCIVVSSRVLTCFCSGSFKKKNGAAAVADKQHVPFCKKIDCKWKRVVYYPPSDGKSKSSPKKSQQGHRRRPAAHRTR